VRCGVGWLVLEDEAIKLLGLMQITCLVVSQGKVKQFC
jgi:hypothetical protein